MRGKTLYIFFIPVLITFLFSLMSFLPMYQTFEKRLYDLFLAIRPGIEQDERLLLLDVDDLAISEVGVWPGSRDIMARGLLLLREFEAGHIVFDIEYTEESPLGVNSQVLRREIPELFQQEFREVQNNIDALFNALSAWQIPLDEAESYIDELQQLTEDSRNTLLTKVREIERDNDAYFGKMAHLNGRSFFTTSALSEEDASVNETLIEYAEENVALTQVTGKNPGLRKAEGIRPAIYPILSRARGAGFPNVKVDPDGVRRRIDLLIEYEDKYFPQLAFAPLLQWLGNPEVEFGTHAITLRDAEHPDRGQQDIKISLTETNHLLINWPQESYEKSFRHLSYYELVYNRELEQRLIENLRIMESAGYLSYYQGDFAPMDAYCYAESIREAVIHGGNPEMMEEYAQVRTQFFDAIDSFLEGPAEEAIIDDIDRVLESGQLDPESAANYKAIKAEVPEVFSTAREVFEKLSQSRDRLDEAVRNSFIIIGHVGTSTTDIGVNPFAKEYMNVGTHASLVNTILQRDFLDELPEWYAMLLGLAAALLITLLIWKMQPLQSIIVGTLFLLLILGADLGVFIGTGTYLPPVIPMFAVFFTFVTLTVMKFLQTAKDRTYIRNAFSHYLSTDVINELLSDPDKLTLGGDKKNMTALFTDVRGLSTISEQLAPTELVKLLNAYLTEMSDIIMEEQGTIDKYEGDAIISFFGAPIEYDNHAEKAIRSAVRMKRAEMLLNHRFIQEKLSPEKVYTRIGINTGEMVVGNMGTAQKMDYTIMGNSVNLASRLEGVNKQYGTWILASETTYKEGGADFAARRLDRVRVVGINEPVRLYEILEERFELSEKVLEALGIFDKGLQAFEEWDWESAKTYFLEVLEIVPDDGPSHFYLERCNKYIKKAPPKNWDGVFSLTLK